MIFLWNERQLTADVYNLHYINIIKNKHFTINLQIVYLRFFPIGIRRASRYKGEKRQIDRYPSDDRRTVKQQAARQAGKQNNQLLVIQHQTDISVQRTQSVSSIYILKRKIVSKVKFKLLKILFRMQCLFLRWFYEYTNTIKVIFFVILLFSMLILCFYRKHTFLFLYLFAQLFVWCFACSSSCLFSPSF